MHQKVKTVREEKRGERMSARFAEFVKEFVAKDPKRAGPPIVEEVEAVSL